MLLQDESPTAPCAQIDALNKSLGLSMSRSKDALHMGIVFEALEKIFQHEGAERVLLDAVATEMRRSQRVSPCPNAKPKTKVALVWIFLYVKIYNCRKSERSCAAKTNSTRCVINFFVLHWLDVS